MLRTGGRTIWITVGGTLGLDRVGMDAGWAEVKLLHETKDTVISKAEERTFSEHQELGVASRC